MRKMLSVVALAACVAVSGSALAGSVKSGLEPGARVGAFNVLDITGPSAGDKLCYRCQYGNRPVVSVFVRDMDESTTKLVSKLDQVIAGKAQDYRMAGFVTMLTDDPDAAEGSLKSAAQAAGIKATPLTVFDNSVGPTSYKLNKDAAVTVMMWVDGRVKVNHAFSAGELSDSDIAKVVGDTAKVLE